MPSELDDFLTQQQSDEDLREDVEPLEDDEDDEEEDDPEVLSGKVCAVCGTPFTEEHDKPVVCKDCSGSKQGEGYPVATHPEE